MTTFSDLARATARARAVEDVSRHMSNTLLCETVRKGKADGVPVEEIARTLNLSERIVSKHWGGRCQCATGNAFLPRWSDETTYSEVDRYVWQHYPERVADEAPFVWSDHRVLGREVRRKDPFAAS